MRQLNFGTVIALIKKFCMKYSTIGITGISESDNGGIKFSLTNGDNYTVHLKDIMVKSVYDADGNNIVDKASETEKVNGIPASTVISRIKELEDHSQIWDAEIGDAKKEIESLYRGENLQAGTYLSLDKKEREVTINLSQGLTDIIEKDHDFIVDVRQGWTCYTNLNGMKIATVGLDYDMTWEANTSNCMGGRIAKNTPFSERFPENYFNVVVSVIPVAYDYQNSSNRIKITPDVQYSKEYTGEWDITWCEVDDIFDNEPTSIHVIWTAIGF